MPSYRVDHLLGIRELNSDSGVISRRCDNRPWVFCRADELDQPTNVTLQCIEKAGWVRQARKMTAIDGSKILSWRTHLVYEGARGLGGTSRVVATLNDKVRDL